MITYLKLPSQKKEEQVVVMLVRVRARVQNEGPL
jgi:hypothetical protein